MICSQDQLFCRCSHVLPFCVPLFPHISPVVRMLMVVSLNIGDEGRSWRSYLRMCSTYGKSSSSAGQTTPSPIKYRIGACTIQPVSFLSSPPLFPSPFSKPTRTAMKLVLVSLLALTTTAAYAQPVKDTSVQFIRRGTDNTYPTALETPPESSIPQAWIDALDTATSAGLIPDIVPSVLVDGAPTYPGKIGYSNDTCNWSITNCLGVNDVSSVPDNEWTVSFDDGPTGVSSKLYDFLYENDQAATHFMVSFFSFERPLAKAEYR
jgi:hypothetical protein